MAWKKEVDETKDVQQKQIKETNGKLINIKCPNLL